MLVIHHLHLGPHLSAHLSECQNNQHSQNSSSHSKKCGGRRFQELNDVAKTHGTLFLPLHPPILIVPNSSQSSSCCPTDICSSKHENYPSVHQQKGCFLHKCLSFKMQKCLSQRALMDSSFIGRMGSHDCQGALRPQ